MTEPSKSTRQYVTLVIALAFFGICIFVLLDNSERIKELARLPVSNILLASIMFVVNIVIRATFNWALFQQQDNKVPFSTYSALYVFTTGLSFFIPASGTVYSAQYLKRHHDVDIAEFVGVFSGFNLLLALSGAIIGIAASVFSLRSKWMGKMLGNSPARTLLRRAFHGLQSMLASWKMVLLSTITVSGLVTTTFVAIWTLCAGAEINSDSAQLLILALSQVLSSIIPLSPGGIGIQETAAIAFGAAMEFDLIDLFFIFILWRVLRTLVLIVMLYPARVFLGRTSHSA